MRRLAVLLLALTALLTLPRPGAASAADVTPFIVGGSSASATELPYQVQVIVREGSDRYLCGGALIAPDMVATAAHCMVNDAGIPFRPADYTATVGQSSYPASGGQSRAVVRATIHPAYTGSPYYRFDAGVLQLASPVTLGSAVAVIALGPRDESLPVGTSLQVSGWGTTSAVPANAPENYNYGSPSPTLRKATVPISSGCASRPGYQDPETQLCAGTTSKDACEGDSGGPLTSAAGGVHLVGLVSAGNGCASSYPGLYTRVGKDSIRAFLLAPLAPVSLSPPALQGSLVAGQTVTCATGSWAGATTLDVRFLVAGVEVAGFGSAAYVLTAEDVGKPVSCQVRAAGGGGAVTADSPAAGPVAAAPPPAPPAPPSVPAPVTPSAGPPVAKVTTARCTKGRCTLLVRVSSTAPASVAMGLRGKAETKRRSRCGKGTRRRACMKTITRTLKVSRRGDRTFRIATSRLEAGRVTFRLVATDAQGRRQARATVVVRRTHR